MIYRVIDPNPEKLNELARLSFNLMVYIRQWQRYYGAERRNSMQRAQDALDKWMAENVEPDENNLSLDPRRQWVQEQATQEKA